MELIIIASWTAIIILASSYWFQIWKIHVHKEVRDLSMVYHILLAVGFGILVITAIIEESLIFLVKQIATLIPVLIIIGQIVFHKKDKWHDDLDAICSKCSTEIEPDWKFCTECGKKVE